MFRRKPKPDSSEIAARTRQAEVATAVSKEQLVALEEKHNYIAELVERLARLNVENGFSEKMKAAYGQR